MIHGQVVVRDGVLNDALRMYGSDIIEILEEDEGRGFQNRVHG
jgi:hypothetical protein